MDDAPQPWPTTDEIATESERPILTVLDTALELTRRTLIVEHALVRMRTPQSEPPTPAEALATSIVVLATSLRESIAGYISVLEQLQRGCRTPRPTGREGDGSTRDFPF
jgi:hypothetical protein